MELSPRGGIDEQTLEIRAAEFTTSDVGDAPMLPELLDQIPPDQVIASVTADGALDTRKCHDAIAARGAAAIIPPRKTAKPWKPDTAGAIARNEALRASRRFGRTIWRPLSAASFGCACRAMDGADITAEAASKFEPGQKTVRGTVFPANGCTVSNCWVSASWRATLTVRSPSSRSVSPFSTASPRSAYPSRKPWDKSVRGKGKSACHPICETEPIAAANSWHGPPAEVVTASEVASASKKSAA